MEPAPKHGYAEGDIAYAWCNYERDAKRYERDPQSVHARPGHTRDGRPLELLANWDERSREWQVFHATRPRKGLCKLFGGVGHA